MPNTDKYEDSTPRYGEEFWVKNIRALAGASNRQKALIEDLQTELAIMRTTLVNLTTENQQMKTRLNLALSGVSGGGPTGGN